MGVSNQLIIDITNSLIRQLDVYSINSALSLEDSILPYAYSRWDSDITIDLDYRSQHGEVDILGDIILAFSGRCDRCGEVVHANLVLQLEETFYSTATEDDQYTYSGTKLDLTQAIIDNILLQLPTSLLCSEQCRGLCPYCGTNLTVSQCECTKIQQ